MKRFKNILFYAQGLSAPCPALERAIRIANLNDARLTVVDTIEEQRPGSLFDQALSNRLNEAIREELRDVLDRLVEPYNDADTVIYTRVLTGIPFIAVIRSVINGGYDLLIKAAQPPSGFSQHLFGSTDLHLMRKCPCTVWIDRPAAVLPYRCILAAVDPIDDKEGDCAAMVMDLATSLAKQEASELIVVHSWQLVGESTLRSGRGHVPNRELDQILGHARRLKEERLAALLRPYGIGVTDPRVHLIKGKAANSIDELSRKSTADLIIMGTVGRTGVPGFFIGNTAEDVLQTTASSVLAVKPRAFVSPVTSG